MPLRNRVTPLSDLVATPARGLVYGNRGCLHDGQGQIRRRFDGRRWIACQLEFRGWRRGRLMQPGRFTELFFLDEATAFAAGHRPCALCRRADYVRFLAIWALLHSDQTGADAVDAQLQTERFDAIERVQRHHVAPLDDLPDGTFVVANDAPVLVRGDDLLAWTPAGYRDRQPRPAGRDVEVVTPPSLVAVLRAGWQDRLVPLLHPSARQG